MAKYTNNYNLKKPEQEDFYNVDDLNENMDIIDEALKEIENSKVEFFNTFQDIPVEGLRQDIFIETRGFYDVGDGGAATYIVTSNESEWSIPMGDLYLDIVRKDYVSYRMFGALLDGESDDLLYMQMAHAYGNEKKVLVKNDRGTLYKTSHDAVKVKYDVDLSGTTIKITNDNVYSWFRIVNDNEMLYSYSWAIDQSELKKNTSYFTMDNNSLPRNAVLHLEDGNVWAERYDSSAYHDIYREELMFHNQEGLTQGALIADWSDTATDLKLFAYTHYNTKRLTFIGCNVSIETTPNVTHNFIVCNRHNTHIKDFTFNPLNNTIANIQFKGATITIEDAYNTKISNIVGNNIAGKPTGDGVSSSGYIIRLTTTFKTIIEDCNLNGYWGCIGTSNVKDVTFRDCSLNRIDTHVYFRDLTVLNCKIYDWGVNLGYGTGLVTIKDCVFINYERPDIGGRTLINLNQFYGLIFSGKIILDNIHVIKSDFDMALMRIYFTPANPTNRDKLKMPNVVATNIDVEDYKASDSKFVLSWVMGEGPSSLVSNKIEPADYYTFKNITYKRFNGENGNIIFAEDSSSPSNLFSDNVTTKVIVENVNLEEADHINMMLPNMKAENVSIGNSNFNIYMPDYVTQEDLDSISYNDLSDIPSIYTQSEIDSKLSSKSNVGHTHDYLNIQKSNNKTLNTGWYTVAENSGSRASAKFVIKEEDSGSHQAVHFYAGNHHGRGNTITVLSNSNYSNGGSFRYIRIKGASTYDGAKVQVYIDSDSVSKCQVLITENLQESGWSIVDWEPDSDDGLSENVRVDLDLSSSINMTDRIAIENVRQPKITVSSSSPSSPKTNDIWIEI